MSFDTPVSSGSTVREALAARARNVAARAGLPLAGGGLLGGSGLPAAMAATGGCPFCVVGVPCPICLLGVGPVLGGVATGSLGGFGLAAWSGSATPDEADSDDDGETDGCRGSACEC